MSNIVKADLAALTRGNGARLRALRAAKGRPTLVQAGLDEKITLHPRVDLLERVDAAAPQHYVDIGLTRVTNRRWRHFWLSAALTAYVSEYTRLGGWPRTIAPGVAKPVRKPQTLHVRVHVGLALRPIETAWHPTTRRKCGMLVDEIIQWFWSLDSATRTGWLHWFEKEKTR